MADEALSPSAQWLALMAMPRPSRVVDFPRLDEHGKPICQIGIWVLTQEEQMAAAAQAEAFTRKLIKDAPKDQHNDGYSNVYNNAASVEVLFRACRRHDNMKLPFFPASSGVRKLSIDEVAVLMDLYFRVQYETGPIFARMDEQEVDAWIKRLAEGGSAFPLSSLSSDGVKNLALSLACRLHTSSTDTCSAGSPPDAATPSE